MKDLLENRKIPQWAQFINGNLKYM